MKSQRSKFLADMRQERGEASPLDAHLNWLAAQGQDGAVAATELRKAMAETFKSPSGLIVLKLMEKSVLNAGVPNGAPDGALREMNAVRNFVLNIRRIVANV